MKVTIEELESRFFISFEAETINEANQLVRMGMNTREMTADAHREGEFNGYVKLEKFKRSNSTLQKNR